MLTKDLKDLSSLEKGKKKVASFKPYLDKSISTWPETSIDEETFIRQVAIGYINAVEYNQCRINNTLRHLYGKPINFADEITSDVVDKIHKIMRVTGKSIKDISRDFRNYLGYRCSFFRKEGHRQVPVDSDRILAAYNGIKNKIPIKSIENILYG